MSGEEGIVDARDHIDDGVADAENVDTLPGHACSALNCASVAPSRSHLRWQGAALNSCQPMISAAFKALGDLLSPEFRSVLFKAVGLTLVLFIAVLVGGRSDHSRC